VPHPRVKEVFKLLKSPPTAPCEEGMLTTEREETTLYDGREWRTHYWRLRKDVILRYAEEIKGVRNYLLEKQPKNVSDDDIYNTLDENAWTTRKINE